MATTIEANGSKANGMEMELKSGRMVTNMWDSGMRTGCRA